MWFALLLVRYFRKVTLSVPAVLAVEYLDLPQHLGRIELLEYLPARGRVDLGVAVRFIPRGCLPSQLDTGPLLHEMLVLWLNREPESVLAGFLLVQGLWGFPLAGSLHVDCVFGEVALSRLGRLPNRDQGLGVVFHGFVALPDGSNINFLAVLVEPWNQFSVSLLHRNEIPLRRFSVRRAQVVSHLALHRLGGNGLARLQWIRGFARPVPIAADPHSQDVLVDERLEPLVVDPLPDIVRVAYESSAIQWKSQLIVVGVFTELLLEVLTVSRAHVVRLGPVPCADSILCLQNL